MRSPAAGNCKAVPWVMQVYKPPDEEEMLEAKRASRATAEPEEEELVDELVEVLVDEELLVDELLGNGSGALMACWAERVTAPRQNKKPNLIGAPNGF